MEEQGRSSLSQPVSLHRPERTAFSKQPPPPGAKPRSNHCREDHRSGEAARDRGYATLVQAAMAFAAAAPTVPDAGSTQASAATPSWPTPQQPPPLQRPRQRWPRGAGGRVQPFQPLPSRDDQPCTDTRSSERAIECGHAGLARREAAIAAHEAALCRREQAIMRSEDALRRRDAAIVATGDELARREAAMDEGERCLAQCEVALCEHETRCERSEVRLLMCWMLLLMKERPQRR